MRRCFAILAIVLAILLGGPSALAQQAPASAPPPPIDRARFIAFVDGAITQAMRDRRIAGVTFSAVDREGVIMARGYGVVGPDRRADADTLFRVGSISKTFVWIALMQLVEQGKITLDDPINDHLPEVLRIPDEGFSQPILIRHLMAHRAGFEDSALGHLFVDSPERLLSTQDYLTRYRVHRVRPPGETGVYSNYGAALAGAVVAHESGQDWPTYAEEHILRPLGMNSNTFREPYSPEIAAAARLPAPLSPDIAARIAQGYAYRGGQFTPLPFEYISQVAPAGALSASANDMTRYMSALLDPAVMARAGVLSESAARELEAPPIRLDDNTLDPLGRGFASYEFGAGRRAFGHSGGTLQQFSLLLVSRELGIGLFMSVNTPTGGPLLSSLPEAIISTFFPADVLPKRDEAAARETPRYAGFYRSLRRPYHRTERAIFGLIGVMPLQATPEGDIVATMGADVRRFVPIGDATYQDANGVGRIAFRDVDGRMRAFESSGVMPAERIGFFSTANWLGLVSALAMGLALVVAGRAVGDAFTRKATRGGLALGALGVLWFVAFALLIGALAPWISDQSAAMYQYPGALLPAACWMLAAAALLTPLAAVLIGIWRPQGWSWLRWGQAGLALAAFAACGLTLWNAGFLGYSGF